MNNEITFGNIHYKILNNVQNEYIDVNNSIKNHSYYKDNINSKVNYFFLFETCFDAAFGHWIFESAVFLVDFKNIKEKFNNIKILVKKNPKRSYKKLFFDCFDIKEDDILYIDNKNVNGMSLCYENIPINNVCIICPNISVFTCFSHSHTIKT